MITQPIFTKAAVAAGCNTELFSAKGDSGKKVTIIELVISFVGGCGA